MEKYEGTHEIEITNFGEDTDIIRLNLTYDEFSLLKTIEDKFKEVHRPYAPQFIVKDTSSNNDLKDKFNKHISKHSKPFKNNSLREALSKVGF